MKLACFCQVVDILSAAAQNFCRFRHIHDPVRNEALEVGSAQRNLCTGMVQCGRTDTQVDIPLNAVTARLKVNGIKVFFVPE